MLFRKKIERMCKLCVHCTVLDEETVLCCKKGVRAPLSCCRKFRYDPCKRIPLKAKAPDFSRYEEYDYSL